MARLRSLRTNRVVAGHPSVHRLSAVSTQPSNTCASRAGSVTAENGNAYTVTISDDGTFMAEYVQPPALSIPLGISGSTVEVRRNEDLTFSAMINGEWVMITAETTVTAANGNVYAAVLSPEGIPIGVMHVAAMQEVMLGALGGTVTVKQAEDMTWWIGEMEVKDGTVYTAANGNMYALMMDSEGMWSAMYQKVMVTVALGTQGSIELVRAEDMSWWLGSEGVGVGSEVMSDNGNTYTLWYTDGVWSARFEPESMMIEGTGLVAMTREADDMYDVNGSTLPASGMGDVTVDGAMYHVWMQGGALMGARFDAAISADTDHFTTNDLGIPRLNSDRTNLIATGNEEDGEGMFSIGDLLGGGMASDEGANFVAEAVKSIEKVQADVAALLALDTKPSGLDTILESQWTKLEMALDTIFNTDSDNETAADRTSAVRQTAPREEDILDDIADVLDALSSEGSFVAATAANGGGVFESQALGAGAAADAFNRVKWTASATMGVTGSTRYGTALRKTSDHAKDGPDTTEYGAFAYSTMHETVRTVDAAAVSLTGIASYSGGTRAISGSGKTYSGMMDLQVRFKANSVSGVVSGLEDSDGLPWQHNFADVDRIVLDDATLRRNAQWNNTGADATVFYTADSGLLRPVSNQPNTFAGILLGEGADAGSEANGTWSIGTAGGSSYLTGGFGVMHVGDTSRPTPSGDDGSSATAQLFTMVEATATENLTDVSIADGTLTVKQRSYGWAGRDGATVPTYQALGAAGDETLITAKFGLAALAGNNGAQIAMNGPKWIDGVISTLTTERDLLSTLQSLNSGDTQAAELLAWQRVQDAVQYNLFGGLIPVKFNVNYADDGDAATADLESEADAIDLINRALDALSSNAKLEAALDPEGTGIFDHYPTGTADDPTTDEREDLGNYRVYDANDRRYEVNTRTIANIRGERQYKVFSAMGTTDFTRFGFWRRESTTSARRNDGVVGNVIRGPHGGPGTYAYSPLDSTNVGTLTNLSFPTGGSARYVGETIALQNTTILSGTAQVDVSWLTPADVNAGTSVGTLSLTISDLASAVGDPLSQGGSADTTVATAAGNEIADIVFPGLSIIVGGQGDFANNMIVGTAGTADDDGNIPYTEATVSGTRYRQAAAAADITPSPTTQSVKALFVGQGVDGPLGVIGTWTLTDDTVGRVAPDGSHTDDLGQAIYGAFGVEVP